jgi:hypothetical protein
MKYKSSDVIKLIDVFYNLSKKGVDGLQEAIESVTIYPPRVIETFLDGIQKLNPDSIKDNYWGTIGYLTLKINLVNVKPDVINTI